MTHVPRIAAGLVLSIAAWGQQAAQPQWQNLDEYNLYQSILKENVPLKKLELIESWKKQFPGSAFKDARLVLTINTNYQLGKAREMLEAARELTTVNPKLPDGHYWITLLTISMNDTSPQALETGERAAATLMANLDTFKPANAGEQQWRTQRTDLEAKAHRTLGWIAWQRKDYRKAEQEFLKALESAPNDGAVSYWTGTVLLAQKEPEKIPAAFFHYARAAELGQAQGGMPDAARKQVQASLVKLYSGYHGDQSGLDELRAAARSRALPLPDLKVESAAVMEQNRKAELVKANPQLAIWLDVKKELTGPNGIQYFEQEVKDTALPKLKGKVISATPPGRPKVIVLGVSDANTAEVTLKLAQGMMPGPAEIGVEIEFEAVPKEFASSPFMLTAEVDADKIFGWPEPPKTAPKKTPKKAAAKKG